MGLRLITNVTPVNIDHVRGFLAGWSAGIVYMGAVTTVMDKRRRERNERAVVLTKRLLEKSWVHLPPEVKDEFNAEIKFFNIVVQEDI